MDGRYPTDPRVEALLDLKAYAKAHHNAYAAMHVATDHAKRLAAGSLKSAFTHYQRAARDLSQAVTECIGAGCTNVEIADALKVVAA